MIALITSEMLSQLYKFGDLFSKFLSTGRDFIMAVRREFYTITMLGKENFLPGKGRVRHLVAHLMSMGVVIDDKEAPKVMITGLPKRFQSLILGLDALGSEDTRLGIEYAKSSLLQEEKLDLIKLFRRQNPQSATLLQITESRRVFQLKFNNCGHSEHSAACCWGEGINGSRPPPPGRFSRRQS